MSDRLTPEREQEIQETQPGGWYDGPWSQGYVEANGEDPAYCRVVHEESGTTLATLPDFAGPIALFIADAHDAVPELLAEVQRLKAALGTATDHIAALDDEIGSASARESALKGELAKAHSYLDATARLAGRQENRIRRLSPEEQAARVTDPARRAAWRMLGKLPHQSREGGDPS